MTSNRKCAYDLLGTLNWHTHINTIDNTYPFSSPKFALLSYMHTVSCCLYALFSSLNEALIMASSYSEQIQILPRTYKEDQGYRADDSELRERPENIIFHADGLKWHVKVTFKAKIGITKRCGLLRRRKKLEALICLIDFRSVPLLPDTVSELVIERASSYLLCSPKLPIKPLFQAGYTEPSDTCWVYTIQEDASRVLYPKYDIDSGLPTMALSEIEEKEQISNNVFLVTWKVRDETFIYKTVEHPFYRQSRRNPLSFGLTLPRQP